MVTEEEIEKAWGHAGFGGAAKIDVVRFAVLKCACGIHQGFTSKAIVTELGLIMEGYRCYELTSRGQYCLFQWFGEGCMI